MRRHGFSPSALLAALVLLLVGPHAMASGGEPAAPGSPDYWVELQSMSFTQGHLEPAFDPDTADYVLMIHNPKVERFSVALTLQTTKYDLMFVPKIIVNDKEFKYSPLEPISPEFMVNETIGEEDKIVTIRLEDPSGCTGWFCKPRGFDYKIRVRQAPEFEKVVLAKSVLVTAPDGSRLWPEEADDEKEEQDDEAHEDQTMRESQYTFVIPDNFSAATIKASCGEYATRTLINGQAAQNGQEVAVQMSAAEETTFFTCAYDNKMWTQNTVARTYQVHFVRKGANKAEPPYVLMMPQVGRCELQRPLGEPKATPHYACQTAFQYVQLVTKYDDPMTEHVYLDDVDGEQGTITLSNGVETSQIPVVKKVHKFKLRMEGLNKAQFDLTVIQSAHCDEMDCPSGYVMAAALNSISANAHMCKGFKCDPAVDSETCCRRAGAPCEDFGKRYNCPKPYKLFTDGFCVGFPCKSADARYCCIGETGFFGALEGIRIQKHWDKVDKEITASLARELEYLDFNVIIDHISDSKKFAKVQKVSPAIQSVVSKLLGVPNGDVSVQTAAIADGIAQAFIRIQSLAGNARNEQLRKKLEEDLQHADKVGADLVKALKSVWDGDLQVAKVSPVERNKPTAPVAEEKILVLVPTSAKLLDSRDAEDQVGSALRVVMEEELKDSTLGLKDNQAATRPAPAGAALLSSAGAGAELRQEQGEAVKKDAAELKSDSNAEGPVLPNRSAPPQLMNDAMEARISSLEQKLLEMLQKTSSLMDAQIASAVESSMAGMEKRSLDVNYLDAAVESRIAGVEQRLSADGSGAEAMRDWIDRLSAAQDQLLKRQLDVESSLTNVLQRLVDGQSRAVPAQPTASSPGFLSMFPSAPQQSLAMSGLPTSGSLPPAGTKLYGLST